MRRLGSETIDIEQTIWEQRERLVRLCSRFTGQSDVAEDLAHEALIEAQRHRFNIRNPEALQAWINGVTRNICLRWLRHTGRESQFRFTAPAEPNQPDPIQAIADDFDLEVELERHELAELLDRAMAALPPETRTVLVQKYIDEAPHAEIAARLGMSAGAVAMRLQRGKLTLRHVLTTSLRHEALSYGFVAPDEGLWSETRMWCPVCGKHRLLGRLEAPQLMLRCPHCCTDARLYTAFYTDHVNLLGDVKGFRRAFGRYLAWSDAFYQAGLASGAVVCDRCGSTTPLRLEMPGPLAQELDLRGVDAMCAVCRVPRNQALHGIALASQAGRQFWQAHERIRALPLREVTISNTPALAVGFETPSADARLEVHFLKATYAVVYPGAMP